MEANAGTRYPRRRIVSYFDHEFIEPSMEKLDRDIREMTDAGFTNVVLCVTETDLRSQERQAYLKKAVDSMQSAGLDIWADPWAVGGVFGGEAVSYFKREHEKHCDCNPHLEKLLDRWLDTVGQLGIETVFWDEPEMHCQDHQNEEMGFLEKYTRKAGELALRNVVCLCANPRKANLLQQVAAMPLVTELATDPYFPNAFTAVPDERRLDYVARWARETKRAAEANGKRSHIWVQNFDIDAGREYMIGEHIAVADAAGVDVAVWGFHGCESVPDFITPGQASSRAMWATTIDALCGKAHT